MANTPTLYIVRGDVADDAKDEIIDWSNTWHMPDLLEAGFYSATRYRCVEGAPEYLHLYEISSPDFFETDAYKYICRCDPPCGTLRCQHKQDTANPTGPQMVRHFNRGSRMVYDTLMTHNIADYRLESPGRHGNPVGSVHSKTVWNVRMDVDPAVEKDFLEWQEQVHMAEVGAFPGYIAGRLARRIDSFSTDDLKYLVVWEVESPDAVKNRPSLASRTMDSDERRIRAGIKNFNEAISVRIWPE